MNTFNEKIIQPGCTFCFHLFPDARPQNTGGVTSLTTPGLQGEKIRDASLTAREFILRHLGQLKPQGSHFVWLWWHTMSCWEGNNITGGRLGATQPVASTPPPGLRDCLQNIALWQDDQCHPLQMSAGPWTPLPRLLLTLAVIYRGQQKMISSAIITCHLESIDFIYNNTFAAFCYYLISFSHFHSHLWALIQWESFCRCLFFCSNDGKDWCKSSGQKKMKLIKKYSI